MFKLRKLEPDACSITESPSRFGNALASPCIIQHLAGLANKPMTDKSVSWFYTDSVKFCFRWSTCRSFGSSSTCCSTTPSLSLFQPFYSASHSLWQPPLPGQLSPTFLWAWLESLAGIPQFTIMHDAPNRACLWLCGFCE